MSTEIYTKDNHWMPTSHPKFGGQDIHIHLETNNAFRFHLKDEYHCDDDCDDICRCGVITYSYPSHEVVKISTDDISIHVGKRKVVNIPTHTIDEGNEDIYSPTEIEKYCLERILKHFKLYDRLSYQPIIEDGYYGEEFHGVEAKTLKNDGIDHFCDLCRQLIDLDTDTDKIRFTLSLEGIAIENIRDGATTSIDIKSLHDLKNISLPKGYDKDYIVDINSLHAIAVVTSEGDIIDGRARVYEANQFLLGKQSDDLYPMIVIDNP